MKKYSPDEIYQLQFVAAPGFSAPTGRRVARLLKAALRSYGLVCIDARKPAADAPPVVAPPENPSTESV